VATWIPEQVTSQLSIKRQREIEKKVRESLSIDGDGVTQEDLKVIRKLISQVQTEVSLSTYSIFSK
jgi:hypothetical protein